MPSMDGTVTLAQESRFQVTDDQGVGHLFILGHACSAEPDQLAPLARHQARIRIRYSEAKGLIGRVAQAIELL